MGRAPCCAKIGLRRGPWTAKEDALLTRYIQHHGEGQWKSIPNKAGLLRCGKSCRLRWMNYLRPDIKRGNIGAEEEDLIIRLHVLLGNRWSLIAGRLPGRTDNEIKNYWNTHLSKKLKEQGIAIKECRVLQRKNNNNKVNQGNEDSMASKIYTPKPTRFTSIIRNTHEGIRNSTHNINESLLISEEEGNDSNNSRMECLKTLWSVQDGGLFSGEFAINNDISSQDDLHERLYQEYLQSLNSEEDHDVPLTYFEDSLFI